jgi:hypothetical protein
MKKIDKNFIVDNQILFLGVAKKYKMFCNSVYKAFAKNSIKVFPVKIDESGCNFETFNSINEIKKMPKSAYSILDTPDNKKIIKELKNKGVTKILFHSKNIIDDELISQCGNLGLEVYVSCPLMLYGKGIHRFHGFLSGVKK